MARKPSALKAQRAAVRRRTMNNRREITLERLLREYRKADKPTVELQKQIQQAIDKAAGREVLHHRTAARMKSRLARAQAKLA